MGNVLWGGELFTLQSERELKRPEGSGMLINDPLGEGSNVSSTNKESDRSQSSGGGETQTLRMRVNSDAQKGATRS